MLTTHGAMGTRAAFSIAVLVAAAAAACASAQDDGPHGIDHSPDTGVSGFCRTTTCPPPAGYPTLDGQCEPPDWSDSDTCRNMQGHPSNAPVWWRSSCVGYDLNVLGSRHLSYDAFATAVSSAFATWLGASCPSADAGGSRVSVDVRDLGPVSCARATYDKTGGPNQNVVVFHDDAWPYEAHDRLVSGTSKSLVIALTTVTFDPQTGELYDADLELNSADYTLVPLDTPSSDPNAYDLQTVLTHETGHFLGLSHSPSRDAVMYASGDSAGGTRKRNLTRDDVDGICAVYPPDHTRAVSPLVDPSGSVAAGACDPTPRHGFSATCN